jgi:hypothetical protein
MILLDSIRFWCSCFRLYGGKGGSAPPPPDYRGAAIEQAAGSKEAMTTATWANRPTVNTPWGQQTWSATGGVDPSTGQPITQWTQNINLTPEEQAALNAQQGIQQGRSQAAQTLLGQATGAFQTPFNWQGLPTAPGQAAQPGDVAGAQQNAYQKMSAMLQPGRMQQEAGLETRLANMGLPMNSEAFTRAKAGLADQWAQQDKGLLAQALAEGRADVGQQFGMAQQAIGQQSGLRMQAIAEEAQRRGMTLNELNALLTGQQVTMPTGMGQPPGATAGTAQAPQTLTAAGMAGNYGLGAAGQQADYTGAAIGGAAAIAAAMI